MKKAILDIKTRDLQFKPFVDQIEVFAQSFKFDEIIEFLEDIQKKDQ